LASGKRGYQQLIAAVNADGGPIRFISIVEKWSEKKPVEPRTWQRYKTMVIEYQNISNDMVYLGCDISHPRADGKIVTVESLDMVCPPSVVRKRPLGNNKRDIPLTLSRIYVEDHDKKTIYAKDTDLAFRRGGEWTGMTFCIVATTCFGDEDAVEVEQLRSFRDKVLFQWRAGRAAIRLYERVGPRLATAIERRPTLRRRLRGLLARAAAVVARHCDLG
jgi:hypothetical protein